MEDQKPRRRPPLGVVVALAAIALSAGSATAWFTWKAIAPKPPTADFPELEINGETVPEGIQTPVPKPIEVPDPPTVTPKPADPSAQSTLYWLASSADEITLSPIKIDVPADQSDSEILPLAFANLMGGPDEPGAATGIPETTKLLALEVKNDGVHVDLSQAYTQGGGSASMIGRLAQVVYTATALDPTEPVWISVEGQPLTLLGGEGLEVRQPITRDDLVGDFGVTAPAE
jgi:spore germination protein GerM